jgi:hypothetical protein
MSTADWVCDSCETNNLAQARVCRVCLRKPGTVAGAVRPIPDPVMPVRQESERPHFVESRHAGQYRPTQPTGPPLISLTPTPARAPRSPRPPEPSPPRIAPPKGRLTLIGLAVAGIIVAVALAIIPNLQDPFGSAAPNATDVDSGSPTIEQTPSATPCPAAVTRWLPSSGNDAVLVAAYTTEKHVVTICRDESGQLFYDGQVKDAPANTQTHISLRATSTANGFVANNKGYVYEIDGSQLILSNEGREIYRTPLTRTGP